MGISLSKLKKKGLPTANFVSERFLRGVAIFSFLLLGVLIYLVYFKAVPYVSSATNIRRSYALDFSNNFKDYLYGIEKLVKTTTETDGFSRLVNQTLNNKKFVVMGEDSSFLLPKPIKYVKLELSNENDQTFKQFFLRDKELFFSIAYTNTYFAVNRMNFAFDFKEVLSELFQDVSLDKDLYIGKRGNVFVIDKGLVSSGDLLKKLDTHFNEPLAKEDVFFIESYGLSLYESPIPGIGRNIFFIYKDTAFSIPNLSFALLIYLTVQSLALLVFIFYRNAPSKRPKGRKNKVNQEILELLKGIEDGRDVRSLRKFSKEEKVEFIKKEINKKWQSVDDFLDFLEQRFGDKVYAFTFVLDREKDEYTYHGRRYFISERFKNFSFKSGAEIIRLLQKNNVLTIETAEAEKSFIDQYLDLLDKQTCAQIYFFPFFMKNRLEGVVIMGF